LIRPPGVVRVLQSPPCAARPHRASAAWSLCRRSSSNRGVVARCPGLLGRMPSRVGQAPTDMSDGRASAAGRRPQSNRLERRFAPTLTHRPKPRRPWVPLVFSAKPGIAPGRVAVWHAARPPEHRSRCVPLRRPGA
jgi:hypothetical protein